MVAASGSIMPPHPPLGPGGSFFLAEIGAKAILSLSLVMVAIPFFGWTTGYQVAEDYAISSLSDCYHLLICLGMQKWPKSYQKAFGHSQRSTLISCHSGT
jgi:hypothetical protein